MTRRRGLWLSLAALALFLLAGRAVAGAYADFRWYDALGALDAWKVRVFNGAMLHLLAFVVGGGLAFANLWGVRQSVVSLVLPRQVGNIEIGEEVPARALMALVIVGSIVLGVAFAVPATDWQGFALAQGGVAFDESDPYFGADLGFFVYWLPFERSVYAWAAIVLVAISVVVVALYALTPSLKWDRGRVHVSAYVRRHIALLGGGALALLAWSFRLDAYAALTSGSAPGHVFGAFDHRLGIPVSMVLAYAAIGSSLVVAWAGWTGQTRVAVAVMTVMLLLTPTLRYALPVAVRWASAPVDPKVREVRYAADRAAFTRRAFGVDRIRTLTSSEAWHSLPDAASVSVWDPGALTRAIERTRKRGPVSGASSLAPSPAGPVFLSVEQPSASGAAPPAGWTLVRSLAASTDERGALVRVDAQGRFPLDDRPLGPVLIFEGARGYAVVADSIPQVAAPSMDTFRGRLAEAWSEQNLRLLGNSARGARIVQHRDVRERVRALVPFFEQGTHVVPIVHGDSLMWAVELYSASADYPLSRRFSVDSGEVTYQHHAGTALVHAYTGRVTVLIDDDPDPIARTWMRRLPVTLSRPQTLAPSLLAALPPDVDGAELQAQAFVSAGTRGEGVLLRNLPKADGADTLASWPARTLLWSPALGTSVWLIPVLDDRDHLSGVLVANGGARRDLRWFKARDSTMAWGGVLERLRHASDSARGASAEPEAAGRVRIIPIANGQLAALQPFYDWPVEAPPRVIRVALAIGDSARAAPSMAAVVGAPVLAGPAPATEDARNERMRVLYAEMRTALQRADWRAFGAAFEALGALVERR